MELLQGKTDESYTKTSIVAVCSRGLVWRRAPLSLNRVTGIDHGYEEKREIPLREDAAAKSTWLKSQMPPACAIFAVYAAKI